MTDRHEDDISVPGRRHGNCSVIGPSPSSSLWRGGSLTTRPPAGHRQAGRHAGPPWENASQLTSRDPCLSTSLAFVLGRHQITRRADTVAQLQGICMRGGGPDTWWTSEVCIYIAEVRSLKDL